MIAFAAVKNSHLLLCLSDLCGDRLIGYEKHSPHFLLELKTHLFNNYFTSASSLPSSSILTADPRLHSAWLQCLYLSVYYTWNILRCSHICHMYCNGNSVMFFTLASFAFCCLKYRWSEKRDTFSPWISDVELAKHLRQCHKLCWYTWSSLGTLETFIKVPGGPGSTHQRHTQAPLTSESIWSTVCTVMKD